MKDKFFWVLLILLIFQGVSVNLLDNRITELEEKAKHFRCFEERIESIGYKSMTDIKARYKDGKWYTKHRYGGGWVLVVDSLDLETRCSPLNND